jgi:hypothetical protein
MIHLFIILKAGSRPQARLWRIAASGQLAPPGAHRRIRTTRPACAARTGIALGKPQAPHAHSRM